MDADNADEPAYYTDDLRQLSEGDEVRFSTHAEGVGVSQDPQTATVESVGEAPPSSTYKMFHDSDPYDGPSWVALVRLQTDDFKSYELKQYEGQRVRVTHTNTGSLAGGLNCGYLLDLTQ